MHPAFETPYYYDRAREVMFASPGMMYEAAVEIAKRQLKDESDDRRRREYQAKQPKPRPAMDAAQLDAAARAYMARTGQTSYSLARVLCQQTPDVVVPYHQEATTYMREHPGEVSYPEAIELVKTGKHLEPADLWARAMEEPPYHAEAKALMYANPGMMYTEAVEAISRLPVQDGRSRVTTKTLGPSGEVLSSRSGLNSEVTSAVANEADKFKAFLDRAGKYATAAGLHEEAKAALMDALPGFLG